MTASIENEFVQLVSQELEKNTLILPTLSDVAGRVRDALESQPNIAVQNLASIISDDPALAIRLIQVANSALYSRGGRQQSSVEEAIVTLGSTKTVDLVTAFAIKQAFTPPSKSLAIFFDDILEQTLAISATCRGLALFCPGLNSEVAMLAGLIHQIGKLPVLSLYEASNTSLTEVELANVLAETHAFLGSLILKKWGFPKELLMVPAEYLNFQRNSSADDYIDVVTVAYLLGRVGSDHPHGNLDWSTVPAFSKLGMSVEFDELTDKGDELRQEMDTMFGN